MSEKGDLVPKEESTTADDNLLAVRPGNERQETGLLNDIPITPAGEYPPPRPKKGVRFEEAEEEEIPAMPPRPTDQNIQNLATLIEAFPDVEPQVIQVVLRAAGNNVEQAFNALLGMSDPNIDTEDAPPPKPPRPSADARQLADDEAYARRLAQKDQARYARRSQPRQQQQEEEDQGFFSGALEGASGAFEDFTANDLPVIKKNLEQGFKETQSKVNSWITGLRKRIDGDDASDILAGQGTGGERQNFGPSQTDQLRGIRKTAELNRARRSMDTERYDADAPALGEDFGALALHDDDSSFPPRKTSRPSANPNLFKSSPIAAPQSGPVDEVDAAIFGAGGAASLRGSPMAARGLSTSPGSAQGSARSKKWQPLTNLAPAPQAEGEDDEDPFSLGDSDDDLKEVKSTDINAEATERLKKAASARVEEEDDNVGQGSSSSSKTLTKAERSGSAGTTDKVAEELLRSA